MCSSAVIVISIAIDRTAAITLRPTPAPIWRESDIAHVTRSDEEVSMYGVRHTAVCSRRPLDMCKTYRISSGTQLVFSKEGGRGLPRLLPGPKHAG
ncbi:hypothetical protein PTSG_12703 [Salpingoeca rosetta]|uniref:Uncharacterized protein n=1 Tax=Salpingoeca rosetta (strain ATCC 50818 / BSB-021) TaxID=946362 RepID=F2UJ83_SALR5|nr:uncharacterized protein PTSG_12703 [Salpingoeca rosetta]EGD77182.1 hypothetical protein PTSG_12703 [Salpingoeca rosetta]|eukprot:XP_004990526.1 hypothetical protein PTSG_12703 [Salpingoeca rosetta]